jgi:hypothetical protein
MSSSIRRHSPSVRRLSCSTACSTAYCKNNCLWRDSVTRGTYVSIKRPWFNMWSLIHKKITCFLLFLHLSIWNSSACSAIAPLNNHNVKKWSVREQLYSCWRKGTVSTDLPECYMIKKPQIGNSTFDQPGRWIWCSVWFSMVAGVWE